MNLQVKDKIFSFTFTIPANKKVYYAGKRRRYGSMLQKCQHKLINDLFVKIIWHNHFEFIDYVFEAHEDGRLHVHGIAIVADDFINILPIYSLRDFFYQHNSIIGIAPSVYDRLSRIEETRTDINCWLRYIEKHQNDIIYKSNYRAEQEDAAKLDNGVRPVLIEFRPISPPPEYYDTYRFTGENKKFFVEI